MTRRRNSGKHVTVAGGTSSVLPALDSLTDLPGFTDLRASERQLAAWEECVGHARDDAGVVDVFAGGTAEIRGAAEGMLTNDADVRRELPGDFVAKP